MGRKRNRGKTQKNGSLLPETKADNQNGEDTARPALTGATTNYREIHENEADALQSIYGDDFTSLKSKPSAWHVSCTRDISACFCPAMHCGDGSVVMVTDATSIALAILGPRI